MGNKNGWVIWVLVGCMVACVGGSAYLVNEVDRVTNTNDARIAEAQAQAQQAQAMVARAQVAALQAEGEKAVLESAARAVDGNTTIVGKVADAYLPQPEPRRDYLPWAIIAGMLIERVLGKVDGAAWLRRKQRERTAEKAARAATLDDRLPPQERGTEGE